MGEIGENLCGHFTASPTRTQNPREGYAHKRIAAHYSRISSVRRFFSFIPAAPRIVRMDFAVRPWRPITFPRSLGWTRSSSTVTCSPSTARTTTWSGLSTSAFAIASTSSFITSLHNEPEQRGVCRCVSQRTWDVLLIQLRYQDRKSTRLNSSHVRISYAVFCLKKKN